MSKTESADLIIKLYDLRREEKMREARVWMDSFFPESLQDFLDVLANPETSAKFRMVISYWDLGAGFVNHGAIDEEMYNDASVEQFLVFAKLYPFLTEIREYFSSPDFMKNLEKLILRMPDAETRLVKRREMTKEWIKKRAEIAQKTQ